MRLFFIIITFLTISLEACCQILIPAPSELFNSPPAFNKAVIKGKTIRSIVADIVIKPDNKVVEDKGLTEGFEFDQTGNLVKQFKTYVTGITQTETFIPAHKKGKQIKKAYTRIERGYEHDTSFTWYYYDTLQRLKIKRSSEGSVYTAYYYSYDSLNNLIVEICTRETNLGKNPNEFTLGVQTIISEETFTYQRLSATQVKKICMNDEGRVYKTVIVNCDEKGNKIEEDHQFVVGSLSNTLKYKFNEKNQLVEKSREANISGPTQESIVYGYDKAFLLSEKYIRSKIQVNEIAYLYNEEGLLTSKVNRNFPDKTIVIVKYLYTFY